MATLKMIKNGVRKSTARRNATPKKVVNGRAKRRNPLTKARVTSFAKQNGLKLVSSKPTKKAANGRKRYGRKSARRNGVTASTSRGGFLSKRNGLLGDSRETAVSVGSLLAGLAITKVESAMLTPLAAQFLGTVGLQNFAKAIVEAGAAVTVNRWAAESINRGSGKFVMYGGLAMAVMSLVESFIPQASSYNPFARANMTPIVLNQPNIVDANALQAAANSNTLGTSLRPRVGTNYRRPSFVY